MDNRDDRATERSGAKEKEEGATLQEKRPRPQGPREKSPRPGRNNQTEPTKKKRKGGKGGREGSGTATPPARGKEAS